MHLNEVVCMSHKPWLRMAPVGISALLAYGGSQPQLSYVAYRQLRSILNELTFTPAHAWLLSDGLICHPELVSGSQKRKKQGTCCQCDHEMAPGRQSTVTGLAQRKPLYSGLRVPPVQLKLLRSFRLRSSHNGGHR